MPGKRQPNSGKSWDVETHGVWKRTGDQETNAPSAAGEALPKRKVSGIDGPYFFKFLVPNHVASFLIGKDGLRVAEIQNYSSCRVRISGPETLFPGTEDRICIVGGASIEDLQKALVIIIEKFRTMVSPNCKKLVLKMVVPMSAASTIIGTGGASVRQLIQTTGCLISISPRVEGFQERVVALTGEEGALQSAALDVVRDLQSDRHLEEHMGWTYTQELPIGAWNSESAEPHDPDYPLMTSEEAKTRLRIHIIDYLRRAAPRDFLARANLLGSTKNVLKNTPHSTLVTAVKDVWQLRRGVPEPPPTIVPPPLARQPLQPGLQLQPLELTVVDAEGHSGHSNDPELDSPGEEVCSAGNEASEPTTVVPTMWSTRTGAGRAEMMPVGLVDRQKKDISDEDPVEGQGGDAGIVAFIQRLARAMDNCLFGKGSELHPEVLPVPEAVQQPQSLRHVSSDQDALAAADLLNGVQPCIIPTAGSIADRAGQPSSDGKEATTLLHRRFLEVESKVESFAARLQHLGCWVHKAIS